MNGGTKKIFLIKLSSSDSSIPVRFCSIWSFAQVLELVASALQIATSSIKTIIYSNQNHEFFQITSGSSCWL